MKDDNCECVFCKEPNLVLILYELMTVLEDVKIPGERPLLDSITSSPNGKRYHILVEEIKDKEDKK
jgi:hypothetical protein